MVDLSTFRARLRHFAKQRYGSLRALAEAAEVNYSQLAEYSDTSLPSGETIRKLAGAGVNVSWLLIGEGAMEREVRNDDITAPAGARYPFEVDPAIAAAIQLAPILSPGDAVGQLRRLNELQADVISTIEAMIRAGS